MKEKGGGPEGDGKKQKSELPESCQKSEDAKTE